MNDKSTAQGTRDETAVKHRIDAKKENDEPLYLPTTVHPSNSLRRFLDCENLGCICSKYQLTVTFRLA